MCIKLVILFISLYCLISAFQSSPKSKSSKQTPLFKYSENIQGFQFHRKMIVEPQQPKLLSNRKIPWIKSDWYPGVSPRDLPAIPRVQLKTKSTFFLNMKMHQVQNTNPRHKKTQIPTPYTVSPIATNQERRKMTGGIMTGDVNVHTSRQTYTITTKQDQEDLV